MNIVELEDAINPTPGYKGSTWHAGHVGSGRNPSTSIYDPRKNGRAHLGFDQSARSGTPILAMFDGEVVWAGQPIWGQSKWKGYNVGGIGGGYVVTTRHRVQIDWLGTKSTRYLFVRNLHMLPNLRAKTGDTVVANQLLGYVGSTGASAGPHNHLEALWDVPYANTTQSINGTLHLDVEALLGYNSPDYWSIVWMGGEDMSDVVRAIQSTLADAGYSPGPTDGNMGPKTRAAMLERNQDARESGADGPPGSLPATEEVTITGTLTR